MKDYNSKDQIWQVVDSRTFGGIESHIFYLSKALTEKGRNICVIFINDYGPHPLEKKLQEHNIHTMKCAGPLDFIQLVRGFTPWLIHSHGYKANLLSRLASKLYNIPTVSSFHAGDCETLRLKVYTTLDRKTAFMGKPVAVNDPIAQTLTGYPQVVDNFVPLPLHHKTVERIHNIGFVGRLSHEKGPDRFIDLARRFPTLNFQIFGDGPMKENLKSSSPENVKFYGHIESLDSAWKEMDILCMPSRKEGLPMAALEAMAHGIPVLTYSVGALPKLIQHDKNGWIIDLPDDKKTCAEDLEAALRELRLPQVKSCSVHARETIKAAYSQETLVPDFIKLYDEVIYKHTITGFQSHAPL